MKKAIKWMIDNHVTVNLVMLLIIIIGVVSSVKINQEVFPEITVDIVSIQVVHRGATPEDVENSVVTKIEEAISDVVGIERVTSVSSEGIGVVNAEVISGGDVKAVKDKIETEVNRILTFPSDSERPVITIAERTSTVIQIGVSGDLTYDEMKKLSRRVKDDLTKFKEISQVGVSGTKNYEISIEVSEDKLQQYGLKFSDISNAIKFESFDMPAGKLKRKNDEILLRAQGTKYNAQDYKEIIIKSNLNGGVLRLEDVANVKNAYEDSDLYSYFNGKPAVMLNIYRSGDQSALKIAKKVEDYVLSIKPELPKNVEITTWSDRSELLEARLDLMLRNAALGFLLVFIVLTLFLDIRLALWVSLGIIISFLGAFVVMLLTGVTINMISLFAFILVLGIVVDDAIVVGEEVYSKREEGLSPREASKRGTTRVAIPITFSIFTTVATFSPMLFVEGRMGQMMYAVPVIVISILLLSLFESTLILPAHLSTIKLESETFIVKISRFITSYVDKALKFFVNKFIEPTIRLTLKYKVISIAMFFATFIASLSIIVSGMVKFQFLPEVEGDNATAFLSMPQGTSISATKKIIDKIEFAANRTRIDLEKKYPKQKGKIFKNIYVSIGEQPSTRRGPGSGGSSIANPSKAEVNIELISSEERDFSTKEVVDIWRKHLGVVSGVENLEFKSALMSMGDAINIEVNGADFKTLNKAVEEIKKKLSSYKGVYNIKDDFLEGKYEIKFELNEKGRALGVRLIDIASGVKKSFLGDEVIRVQRGKDEVKIRVQYPQANRKSIDTVKNMKIRTAMGLEIPLSEVASFKMGRGFSTINHSNNKRVIKVIASVDESVNSANEINKKIKKYLKNEIQKKYYGLGFNFEGAQKEQMKSINSLKLGFMIALFFVYMLLAIPFKSYSQPFIIMFAIPFGVIGAIWAHFFLGYNFTFLSAIGVVALSGVVVNDSLVLVDYINELFRNDENLTAQRRLEHTVTAVKRRFRPIFLTSVTTFFGLLPMIFEKSMQAKFLIPMAISLGFGIIFATIITLYLIPAGILVLEDIKAFFRGERNV